MAPRTNQNLADLIDDDFDNEDLHDEGQEDEGLDNQGQGSGGQDDGAGQEDDDASGQDEQQARGSPGGAGQVDDLDDDEFGSTAPPPRQLSRGERRNQRLANELREQRERNDRIERDLQELRRSQQASQQPQQRDPTREEMALWTPEERMNYNLERSNRQFQTTLQQMQAQQQDQLDRSSFDMLCAKDPRAQKLANEVETRLQDMRRQGQNVQRELLFKFILGERVFAARTNGQTRQQRQQGQQRIRQQQGASAPPRSDRQGGRQQLTEQEKRTKRLENVTF